MHLSEFYRLAKGKHKSAQQEQEQDKDQSFAAAAAAAGPSSSSLHGGDFVELVWESGQVKMKGQPNRSLVSKPSHITNNNACTSLDADHLAQSFRSKDKGAAKGECGNVDDSEMMEPIMNDFQIPGPSEHDDITHWLSYHMDGEPVQQHGYSPDFFAEVSDVTAVEPSSARTCFTPLERPSPASFQKNTVFEQRHLSSVRPNMSQLDRVLSLQSLCSFPSFRPKVSYGTTQNISCSEPAQERYLSSVHPSVKMHSQHLGQRGPRSSAVNFPQFAALVRPGLDAISGKANPEVSFAKKVDGKGKESVPICGKPASPSQVPAVLSIINAPKMTMPKSLEMSHRSGHSSNVNCQGKQAVVANERLSAGNVDKAIEPVVASSICSGNRVDIASNDLTYGLKRKYTESEDSEYPSEDVEDESMDIKEAANNRVGFGSKRSRAAEVHNLSERRRRDRINEKMRALQELIPNCNKVDKASMLDEAIEYLKTLQLQLQMMSMGPGICMPRMMLPHAAHMPLFSPIGIGMGYGLGMLDVSMNSSNCPPMQIPRFPDSGFGALNLNPMPNNIPMFGFQGQGVAMPMSHGPVNSAPACPPIRMAVGLNNAGSALPSGNFGSVQTSYSRDTVHNVTLERPIANQAANHEPNQAALLLEDERPSTSEGTEASTKS